jgi:hypothetical protein
MSPGGIRWVLYNILYKRQAWPISSTKLDDEFVNSAKSSQHPEVDVCDHQLESLNKFDEDLEAPTVSWTRIMTILIVQMFPWPCCIIEQPVLNTSWTILEVIRWSNQFKVSQDTMPGFGSFCGAKRQFLLSRINQIRWRGFVNSAKSSHNIRLMFAVIKIKQTKVWWGLEAPYCWLNSYNEIHPYRSNVSIANCIIEQPVWILVEPSALYSDQSIQSISRIRCPGFFVQYIVQNSRPDLSHQPN